MSEFKKPRLESSTDPKMWMKWYEELSSEEECDLDEEDEDEIEEDFVEKSDHQSESEQDISSDEDQGIPDQDTAAVEENKCGGYYLGKDKITKWKKSRSNLQVRVRSHNIIKLLPGPKGSARDAVSEIDCIKLFITDSVIRMITSSTNRYIEKIKNKFQRDRDVRLTDEREISAFIGILFLIGTLRSSIKNAHKIWNNSKGSGIEACYLAMSEKRFRFILRCLRFDDITTRNERREIDKFAPIREVFETFLATFQKNFISSEFLTIDEQLLAFRGRCSFRQYMPRKPARYGVKMFALVDAKTSYTFNLEPYLGAQPEGPYKLSNSPNDLVLRLVQPVEGTNRNITGDNWFTSVPLAIKLLEKKLTYVGTMRKNKREIPTEFLPTKNREEKTSIFGFREDLTMASYCPKKNKAVIVISSMHHDSSIDPESGENRLPEIITCYNQTKVGVDLVDQMSDNYNVARTTNRWPMVVFYDLLNISGINACCVYKANHPNEKVLRSDFIEKFAWELIKPQIEHRSTISVIPREIRRRARHLLGLEEVLPPPPPPDMPGSCIRRCYICTRSRNKSTRKICHKCSRHACKEHMVEVCTSCLSM
ncbi:unnamed protein product [Acanthoscelides obtectus]|uniref:PiggyBac transposable element-derived protein domain-containing protein n=1 Tax=Acanthoscelides obtectus TaxID=200917 RepID=A0A9P0M3C1_ACAOB|nr:unnamed protein product [Acanthoscelides obtectus]CAK1660277.1 PiggyBac transposable element-derived protein 4 [Acanthoscelides obtectus]